MSEASELQDVAVELITEFGELCAFSRTVEGVYNPDAGESFGETPVLYSGYVVPMAYSAYELANSIVEKNDIKLLTSKMTQVPATGDILTFNQLSVRIVNVLSTRYQGNDIIYTLQVRK